MKLGLANFTTLAWSIWQTFQLTLVQFFAFRQTFQLTLVQFLAFRQTFQLTLVQFFAFAQIAKDWTNHPAIWLRRPLTFPLIQHLTSLILQSLFILAENSDWFRTVDLWYWMQLLCHVLLYPSQTPSYSFSHTHTHPPTHTHTHTHTTSYLFSLTHFETNSHILY